MYPWWIYVLPAVITGLVAIVVQLVAAMFTAKREQARLDFERERWEIERAHSQRSLVFSAKQEAFNRFISDYHAAVNAFWNHAFHESDDTADDLLKAFDAATLSRDGLAVFDEKAFDIAESLTDRITKLEIKDSSEFWPKIEPLNDDFGRLIDHMRDSLAAIEIVETRLHNQPQLNEARTSGDEKSTKSRGST